MEKITTIEEAKQVLEGIGYSYSIDYCQRFSNAGCLENHIELTTIIEDKDSVIELINRIDFDTVNSKGDKFILKKYEPCAKLKSSEEKESKPVKANFIEKEKFVEILNKIVEQMEFDRLAAAKLQEVFTEDRIYIGYDHTKIIQAAKIALEELTGDQDCNWIDYWLYELDCGKNHVYGAVTFNGVEIPLETVEDLYDMLKNDYEKEV